MATCKVQFVHGLVIVPVRTITFLDGPAVNVTRWHVKRDPRDILCLCSCETFREAMTWAKEHAVEDEYRMLYCCPTCGSQFYAPVGLTAIICRDCGASATNHAIKRWQSVRQKQR